MTDDEQQVGEQPYFVQRLKIDGDADERAIKRAYARELKLIDQETDPAGFQDLREAYDAALFYLRHAAQHPDDDAGDQFDEIGRAAQALVLLPAGSGAHETQMRQMAPEAHPHENADTVAQAVFAAFTARCAVLDDVDASAAWERQLQASLADPRLILIAARQAFEQRIADLLAAGWRPGHHILLVVATKAFEWESDRRRVQALGMAGYTLHFAIEQRAMYDLQSDYAREQQRSLILRLREAAQPSTLEVIKAMPVLATLETYFPAWLALVADADTISRWHNVDQTVPSWKRRLSRREFQIPFATFVALLLLGVYVFYGISTRENRPTPQAISAQHLEAGNGFLDNDEYDKALLSYDAALKADPGNATAYGTRAMALASLSQKARALADLEKLESLAPLHPVLFRVRGAMAQREGRHQDAVAAHTRALELDPANNWTLMQRGLAYRAIGELDNAVNDADRSLEIDPGRPSARLLRARVFIERKEMAAAKAEAQALLQAADKRAGWTYFIAAIIFKELGDRPGAVAILDQAVAAFPSATTYLRRADARPPADLAARRADIEAALRLDPDVAWGRFALVKLELEAKQWSALTQAADRALESDSLKNDRRYLLTSRGIGYAKRFDMQKANEDFESARLAATTAVDLNNLCYEMAVHNVALQTALAHCKASLEQAPNNVATLDSQGFTLLRLQRYREALAAYDAALKVRGEHAYALYGRGVVKYRLGDKSGGRADIKAALALGPGINVRFARMDVIP